MLLAFLCFSMGRVAALFLHLSGWGRKVTLQIRNQNKHSRVKFGEHFWWVKTGHVCFSFTSCTILITDVTEDWNHLLRKQGHNLFCGRGGLPDMAWIWISAGYGLDIWIASYRLKTSTAISFVS